MTRTEPVPLSGGKEDLVERICGVVDDAGQDIQVEKLRDYLLVTVEWMHPDAFDRAPGSVGNDGVKRWASGLARFRFSRRPIHFTDRTTEGQEGDDHDEVRS